MKTIALHLQKGGVGKTTLSGTLAYLLSANKKILLVDCDAQGNSSSWLLGDMTPSITDRMELANVLMGDIMPKEAIVNVLKNLDILPTKGRGSELKRYSESQMIHEPFVFVDLVAELAKLNYDYIIMDLSPGMGLLERSSILACDEVITPMTPEYFSLEGLAIFNDELQKIKKQLKAKTAYSKIIINNYDNRIRQHKNIVVEASKITGFNIFIVPIDAVFRKAQSLHTNPFEYSAEPMRVETKEALLKIVRAL